MGQPSNLANVVKSIYDYPEAHENPPPPSVSTLCDSELSNSATPIPLDLDNSISDSGIQAVAYTPNSQQQQENEENCQEQEKQDNICQFHDPLATIGTIPTGVSQPAITPALKQKQFVAELQCRHQNTPIQYFLSCQRCVSQGVLRPHCKCGDYLLCQRCNNFLSHCKCREDGIGLGLHECVQMCPDLTKCTKEKRQMSHCFICFDIGRGISKHKIPSTAVIDVYSCANCAEFYSFWNSLEKNETETMCRKMKLENLKCESKSSAKGNCLQARQRKGHS